MRRRRSSRRTATGWMDAQKRQSGITSSLNIQANKLITRNSLASSISPSIDRRRSEGGWDGMLGWCRGI